MLAFLSGTIQLVQPSKKYLIVVVQSLGYKIFVPGSVLNKSTVNDQIDLYLHHVIREDVSDLYGFVQPSDLAVFEQLISVSGVGPKVGLALLTDLSADTIVQAIRSGDTAMLTQVSGIGKKIAERLVVELRSSLDATEQTPTTSTLVEALQQLGYSVQEIRQVVQQLNSAQSTEQQLKQALSLLSHG
ncbi:MAG: Holliday junction branch migration protein RuvA [Patescibacteria group bacterium]